MKEFDKIHLVWRKGQSSRRHNIGILEKMPDGNIYLNTLMKQKNWRALFHILNFSI